MQAVKKTLTILGYIALVLVIAFCAYLIFNVIGDIYELHIKGSAFTYAFGFLIFLGYFYPGVNASSRKHKDKAGIWILNIILGWTAIGWVGALIWSYTGVNRSKQQEQMELTHKQCPYCAESIKSEATICRFCNKVVQPIE